MMRGVLILVLVSTVAGCATVDRLNPFGRKKIAEAGLSYRAALRADKDGLLTVSVKAPGEQVAGVRESVRYPVTRYCLKQRGVSDADWVLDAATGDWAYTSDGQGTLTFQARCRA